MSNKEGLDMDNLFKALLIIILVAFLYLYYENTGNGRYIKYKEEGFNLLDTKTGKVYYRGVNKVTIHDLPNATRKEIDVKEQ